MGRAEEGKGLDRELAWGGFLAELVSLIRDDLLDANVQEFEGRHVMAGDKDKEQTYRGPLTRPLQPAVQKDMGTCSVPSSTSYLDLVLTDSSSEDS